MNMKTTAAVFLLATATLLSSTAYADSMGYLVSQGFQIKSVIRYGIDGEREVYLQRKNSMFICWRIRRSYSA
jgi:hypothetical protein